VKTKIKLLLCLIAAYGTAAAAADYPVKPVRIIVPFAAGGAADAVTRVVAHKLTEYWGKQVILDNRPGIPGVMIAANAPADGYALLMAAGSNMVTTPLTMRQPPYDPQKAFAPVGQIVNIPPILTTHPSLGVKNLKELIALAKRRPGELNYSSSGIGAPNHLAMALLETLAGIKMVHVPYKGGAISTTDLMSGQVQLAFNAIPSVLQYINTGKLTAIAVSSAKRAQTLPQLPTMAETLPGFQYNIWYGLFAPAGTPPELIQKISTDVQRALKEPDVIPLLTAQGTEPAPTTSQQLAAYIREDTERWARIVRERDLKVD
jgi:tripartite-type tricarboxylate transporter receptor subunit TctC